jgi:predicted nuclease with RNAse H fold
MTSHNTTIGIDVGGIKKGFHAVANRNGQYLEKFHSSSPDEVAAWALAHQPRAVAIDAPSMFSLEGSSRQAERDLVKHGMRCFYTPTRALATQSRFYDWVFNGEQLYQALGLPIFMGGPHLGPCLIESFPHGIQISLWSHDQAASPQGGKQSTRQHTLVTQAGYNISQLTSIDFIDAALCAVTADYFVNQQYTAYGCETDGFIIMPKKRVASASYP